MMRRLAMSLALATICLAAAPATAMAFNPFGGGSCTANTSDSAACKATSNNPLAYDPNDPTSAHSAILLKVTNIIAYLAGAIALIMIIVSAVRFVTSGSDVSTGSRTDTDVEDARRSLAGALIGLAIIILAKAIITYVIKRL